jgi:hypothetical protein
MRIQQQGLTMQLQLPQLLAELCQLQLHILAQGEVLEHGTGLNQGKTNFIINQKK